MWKNLKQTNQKKPCNYFLLSTSGCYKARMLVELIFYRTGIGQSVKCAASSGYGAGTHCFQAISGSTKHSRFAWPTRPLLLHAVQCVVFRFAVSLLLSYRSVPLLLQLPLSPGCLFCFFFFLLSAFCLWINGAPARRSVPPTDRRLQWD